MVVVHQIVVHQGISRPEDQPAGPVGGDAVIAHDAAIRQGGRTVEVNPIGVVVVKERVSNQRAMGRFPDINAVIQVVGAAVVMHREAEQLIVGRANHKDALPLGIFDLDILQANEAGGPRAGIGNLNPIV